MEALLLDLLRLVRKHYECIRQVRKPILMLNDETLKLNSRVLQVWPERVLKEVSRDASHFAR